MFGNWDAKSARLILSMALLVAVCAGGTVSVWAEDVAPPPTSIPSVVDNNAPAASDPPTEPGAPAEPAAPATPDGLSAVSTGLGGELLLAWNASPEPDASYVLLRSVDPDGGFTEIASGLTAPSFLDSGLQNGVTYRYEVGAVVAGNPSSFSGPVAGVPADTTPPAVPRGLSVTDPLVGTRLVISWTGNDEADFSGYTIYRDSDPDGAFTYQLNERPLSGATFTDTGLTRNTTYYYRIAALDTTGNSSLLSSPVGGTPVDLTPPIPPDVTAADLHTGRDLDLSWAVNTVDDDLAGYHLYRSIAAAGPFARVNQELLAGSRTFFPESRLPRDQTFWYYLTAVDRTGNESPPGQVVSITPVDLTPPIRPAMFGVNDPGDGIRLIVSWAENREDDLAGYLLYAGESATGDRRRLTPGLITGAEYTDYSLGPPSLRWYRVSAVDRYGNESEISEAAYGIPTDRTPPTFGAASWQVPTPQLLAGNGAQGPGARLLAVAPGGVAVLDPGVGGALQVDWTPSPSTDTAGYNVWYSSSSAGPYLKANQELVTASSFLLVGLTDGFPVYFRVSAVDTSGNESAQVPAAGVAATPSDRMAPSVVRSVPAPGEPRFEPDRQVTIVFDRPMDPACLNPSVLTLTPTGGTPVTPRSVSYDPAAWTARFLMPPLLPNTGYAAKLTGMRNASGFPRPDSETWSYQWSFTTGTSTFASPHGDLVVDPANCAICHRAHTARSPYAVVGFNETATCFFCHDGTQADSNIARLFAENSGNLTRHPVADTPAVQQGLIRCSDCHNPHGDRAADGYPYPELLSASDSGVVKHQGNDFCLVCHGVSGSRIGAGPYASTAGDHTSTSAVHLNGNPVTMTPSSGSGIACVQCHQSHAAPVQRLLARVEADACFVCHSAGNVSLHGRNIAGEFGQPYLHKIGSGVSAGETCTSCHGPHTVARADFAAGGSTSQISNPANTKQEMAQAAGSTQGFVRITQFCLACHRRTPPVAAIAADTLVPRTISFPDRLVTTNAGSGGENPLLRSWDKTAYSESVHYRAGIGCTECHSSHGSPYALATTRAEDTAVTGSQGICGRCHSGNPPAEYADAPNIFADLTRTGSLPADRYRHPTLSVSGRHTDTEDPTRVNQAGNQRHAECMDCHDPHNDRPYTPVPAPAVTGPVRNVSGVAVAFGSVTWDDWDPGQNRPPMLLVNPIQNQYELCLKCHSAYSWQNSPPILGGLTPETDTSREFNPNNPAGHAVIGASRIGTFTYENRTYRYGRFATPTDDPATRDNQGNAWSATSQLYCEDCHRSSNSAVAGVHGSAYGYLLRAPWSPNSGHMGDAGTGSEGTGGDLCFKCHDYGFYAGGDPGSPQERSAFSGDGEYNLHGEHEGTACSSCHVTVAHGWKIKGMLANKSAASSPDIPGSGGDPTAPSPYYDGSWLSIRTWRSPGNWTEGDCGDCHGSRG